MPNDGRDSDLRRVLYGMMSEEGRGGVWWLGLGGRKLENKECKKGIKEGPNKKDKIIKTTQSNPKTQIIIKYKIKKQMIIMGGKQKINLEKGGRGKRE